MIAMNGDHVKVISSPPDPSCTLLFFLKRSVNEGWETREASMCPRVRKREKDQRKQKKG